jgi:hypothetical protein
MSADAARAAAEHWHRVDAELDEIERDGVDVTAARAAVKKHLENCRKVEAGYVALEADTVERDYRLAESAAAAAERLDNFVGTSDPELAWARHKDAVIKRAKALELRTKHFAFTTRRQALETMRANLSRDDDLELAMRGAQGIAGWLLNGEPWRATDAETGQVPARVRAWWSLTEARVLASYSEQSKTRRSDSTARPIEELRKAFAVRRQLVAQKQAAKLEALQRAVAEDARA